jgi:hypothetical protein
VTSGPLPGVHTVAHADSNIGPICHMVITRMKEHSTVVAAKAHSASSVERCVSSSKCKQSVSHFNLQDFTPPVHGPAPGPGPRFSSEIKHTRDNRRFDLCWQGAGRQLPNRTDTRSSWVIGSTQLGAPPPVSELMRHVPPQ